MHHERAGPSSGCQRTSAPWESAAAGEKWRKEILWAMMGGFGSDASTGHMAHVCPLLPGGGPVGPTEPCLALQGCMAACWCSSEGFEEVSRKTGVYCHWEVSPNHQQNTECKKILETIHPRGQNKSLGHDKSVFVPDICQTWPALLRRKFLRVSVKAEMKETA